MILLKREQNRITVICEKQKDAPHFDPYTLELAPTQDSCVLVTAENPSAVSALFPGDPRHVLLSLLQSTSMEDGLSTSAWLKASGLKDRTFYECRKFLVANGYVARAAKRGAPNVITEKGTFTVTANCNVTAD